MRAWIKSIVLFAGFFVCVAGSGTALAELKFSNLTLEGEIELGGRFFLDRPSPEERGKFEEYRDISPGVFLENLDLLLYDNDENYFHELIAREAGEDDQTFIFRSSKIGVYSFEFMWDQIPHVFSTNSILEDKISLRRDTAQFSFSYTPTPEWDIDVEYIFTDRHGDMPKGAVVDPLTPPATAFDFTEFLEPIKYTTHDATLSTSLAKRLYQLQLSYNLSLFENDVQSVVNPAPGVPIQDRIALPPDNVAHTINLTGGVNLPYRTRVNGLISYGLRLQDDELLPLNPAVAAAFPGTAVGDFDGEVNITHVYLSALSRPLDPLTLKAMYRLYDYDDTSEELTVPHSPATAPITTVTAVRFPYTKQNAGLEGKWQFPWPVSLGMSYNWENWDREDPLAADTNEQTPRIALDATPLDWLLFRLSYAHSTRTQKGDKSSLLIGHVPEATGVHTGVQPKQCIQCHPAAGGPFPLFSKFNFADRERDRVEFLTEITPLDTLSFSVTYGLAKDNYNESFFGLEDDDNWSIGGDISWTPIKRLAFHFSYVHEEYRVRQRDNEFVDIDQGELLLTEDSFDTFGVGMKLVLLPEKLDLESKWSYSFAQSNFNNSSLPGQELPDLENTFSQFETYLRYHITKHWAAKLGYIFEDFDITDAYTRNVQPVAGGQFLTSDFYSDYTAHLITLSLLYRF